MAKSPHAADPLPANVACEQRAEPVPSVAHRLVADVDTALEEQVFHVPEAEREAHVHHHRQPDHLARRVEVADGLSGLERLMPLL